MLDVEALGDAAALLARRRSYRELPMQWVISQVQRVGGWTVLGSQTFPMHITPSSLYGQLSFARDDGPMRVAYTGLPASVHPYLCTCSVGQVFKVPK